MNKMDNFGTFEQLKDIYFHSIKYKELINEFFEEYSEKLTSEVHSTVFQLLGNVSQLFGTFILAYDRSDSATIYILGRVILETIINICYIFAGGEKTAKMAQNHYKQKVYRDQKRELKTNTIKILSQFSPPIDISEFPEIKKAYETYTSNKGKEIRDWTDKNLISRINIIESKYGERSIIGLSTAFFTIYRFASEIIHGTFYGAIFRTGMAIINPPKGKEEVMKNLAGNITLIQVVLMLAIGDLFKVFSAENEDFVKYSNRCEDLMNELFILLRVNTKKVPSQNSENFYPGIIKINNSISEGVFSLRNGILNINILTEKLSFPMKLVDKYNKTNRNSGKGKEGNDLSANFNKEQIHTIIPNFGEVIKFKVDNVTNEKYGLNISGHIVSNWFN